MAGLLREAIDRAMADAQVGWDDIDAVVVGKAPDFFEGVMMPELFLADALGAVGKPLLRVHTAGSVGGSTGDRRREPRPGRRARARARGRVGEAVRVERDVGAVDPDPVQHAGQRRRRRLLRAARAQLHPPQRRAEPHRRDGRGEGPAERREEPVRAPAPGRHHLESVQASQMLWDPIRYDETCPSSDGACAVVIGDADAAKAAKNPAWIHATAMRSEPTTYAGRDQVNPQAGRDAAAALWKQAGITDPRNEIDAAEIYVPFSWFEPMWLETLGFMPEGEGWKLTEAGETALDGSLPINASGGVLSSNPIGASGLLRFAEAAMQVMGRAGDHQVDGARKALGHAYGGGSQFFAMWVVGADQP